MRNDWSKRQTAELIEGAAYYYYYYYYYYYIIIFLVRSLLIIASVKNIKLKTDWSGYSS